MSSTKPLDVVILPKAPDGSVGDPGEPYQEFGEKLKAKKNDWSCYILAKEGEVSVTAAFRPPYSRIPT